MWEILHLARGGGGALLQFVETKMVFLDLRLFSIDESTLGGLYLSFRTC